MSGWTFIFGHDCFQVVTFPLLRQLLPATGCHSRTLSSRRERKIPAFVNPGLTLTCRVYSAFLGASGFGHEQEDEEQGFREESGFTNSVISLYSGRRALLEGCFFLDHEAARPREEQRTEALSKR